MRRTFAAALFLTFAVLQAAPARGAAPGRVVVVTVDGTRLGDWLRPGLTTFGTMLERGAFGLLSTRTAAVETTLPAMRREAYRALGSGAVGAAEDPARLARTLETAGVTTTVIASSVPGASSLSTHAVELPEIPDGVFPTGRRTDYTATRRVVETALGNSRVVIVDLGDTARVEQVFGARPGRASWMRLSMSRADSFLGWLGWNLTADDVLIVVSPTAPVERQRNRRFLSAVAMTPAGVPSGSLSSRTTGRDRVVTIADIAPTILQRSGVAVTDAFAGRPFGVVRDDRALDRTVELESALIHASAIRGPFMRVTIFGASAIALISVLLVASGRGRGGRARGFPATWRGFLDVGLVAVVAIPAALILEPLSGTASTPASAAVVFGGAIAVALALRMSRGSHDAIAGLCWATAGIIAIDLILGGPLAERSSASYLIAEGARFHGIGNELMGVLIGAVLIGCSALLDQSDSTGRRRLTLVILVVVAAVMAAPSLGDKFGSIPAAVPAFGLFGLFAVNVRLTVRSAIAVAIVTLLVAGLAIAADALRNPDVQSHVGRAIGNGGGGILGRKIDAAGRLLAFSYWVVGVVVCGGSIIAMALRRQNLVSRGLWGFPALRRGLICCAVAGVGAVGANDAGVIAAAWLALLVASSFFATMLVPQEP